MVSKEHPRKQIARSFTNSVLKIEDVPGNTWGQLIDLQSETCHTENTASWNTFLCVEFVREYTPNSDSDSAVPDIFWLKNRQSASEANPVKVLHDAVLPVVS